MTDYDNDDLPPVHGEVILGDVSAERIAGRLSRHLGELSGTKLTALDAGPLPIARWDATDADGRPVIDQVVLHHLVDDDVITLWVETGPAGGVE